MGLTEVIVGLAPPLWVHALALNALGHRNANLFLQLGKTVDAQGARNVGFVDALVNLKDLPIAGTNDQKDLETVLDDDGLKLHREALKGTPTLIQCLPHTVRYLGSQGSMRSVN